MSRNCLLPESRGMGVRASRRSAPSEGRLERNCIRKSGWILGPRAVGLGWAAPPADGQGLHGIYRISGHAGKAN